MSSTEKPAGNHAMAKQDAAVIADRIIDRVARLTNHLLYVISAHEANRVVLYSDVLSSQIPRSFAANAFNRFREAMICNEVVRLAACWLGEKEDDVSIPSVLKDLGRPGVTDLILDRLKRPASRTDYAAHLDAATTRALSVKQDRRFASFINHRHKHLAHNLVRTNGEKRAAVDDMKMGIEGWLLDETLEIVDKLYLGTMASGFAWDVAKEDSLASAKSLWHHCSFNIRALHTPPA